jgi:hypothetical protein
MIDADRLTVVRVVHTLIYVVMAASALLVLYAGVTGATGPWLWAAAGLTVIESVVFIGNGMRCPLTAVAVRYGARKDGAYDTLFPDRITRHTATVFGPIMAVGLILILLRWLA